MTLLNYIDIDGTEYEFGGYATRFFTQDKSTGYLNFSGANRYTFDRSIGTSYGLLTGNKTGSSDAKDGAYLTETGRLLLQHSTQNPGILFYGKDSTSSNASLLYNISNDYMLFGGAVRYQFDNAIMSTSGIWSGGKTAMDDGSNGCYLSATGSLHLQNNNGNPYIGFYGKDQTSYGTYISYTVDDDRLVFGGASRYSFGAPLYVNGTAVSLNGHEHTWTVSTPSQGATTTLTSKYCAYSTSLDLGVIRLVAKIKPTSNVTAGTSITVAELVGDIVPKYICPLATATGSTDSRRWNAWINSSGQISVRPSTALTSGTEYNVYICGTYPLIESSPGSVL